jgi:hypothetical protein
MLRSLFQSVEQWLGPSLGTVATIVYWLAMAMLAHRIAAPLIRLRMEMVTAKLKMEQSVVMECPYCHRETVVHDSQCAFCRKSLELPLSMKVWHFIRLRRQPRWLRWTRWGWEALGLVLFIVLTVAGFIAGRAWAPAGALAQLFVGMAIVCWVAIGWLVARVLHIGGGGPLARLRDALFAFAAAGVMAVVLFLATESRPVSEAVLWRINVGEGGIAQIEDKPLPLPQGMIGFEYLQVDHELLGYHRIIPVAFLGAERMPVRLGRIEKWFLDTVWKSAQGYSERGLSVRSRVEQYIVVPHKNYEVVERERQVFFRPAGP